jgi:formate dehydrogenase maturation protein FdhE
MQWPNVFDKRAYKWEMAAGEYIGSSMYKDQLDANSNSAYHIQSKIIKDNFIELFIRYNYRIDEIMNLSKQKEKLEFLSQLIAVQIDDVILEDIEWHPTWSKNSTNIGITAMIPIKDLNYGKHVLVFGIKPELLEEIYKDKSLDAGFIEELKRNNEYTTIPFWKNSGE